MTNFELWKESLTIEKMLLDFAKYLHYMSCKTCPAKHTEYCITEKDSNAEIECMKWIAEWANAEYKDTDNQKAELSEISLDEEEPYNDNEILAAIYMKEIEEMMQKRVQKIMKGVKSDD